MLCVFHWSEKSVECCELSVYASWSYCSYSNYSYSNNNNQDNVYGAVIIVSAEQCRAVPQVRL